MTKHRVLLWILVAILLAAVAIPAQAAPPKEPAPKVGPKAGSISALLPVARIVRGSGRNLVTSEAKKGDDLVWNDLLKTERGGRARITLVDQSILSLGSQAELRIVRHDSRSQQTALALGYGRLRAEVTKIARQGGSFELKTPTAVAGVIGTDFGTDASSVGTTTFLCISGVVQVGNVDPAVQGTVQCSPGMTTSVAAGKPPSIPTGATQEQIQKLMEDTEPALIAAMSPTSSLPGVSVDATITGSKLAGIKKADISGSGVAISLAGTPTDTSVTVHLVINKEAGPGPRTITLTKQSGAASAAVFNILAPPTPPPPGVAAGVDSKKPYHDTFEQERQSARAGLGAYVVGAQQAADLALQQLQQANQGTNVDLTQAATALTGHVAAVQKAVDDAGGQIDTAKAAADSAFDTQYQTAYNALLQRNPAGAPDDAFNQGVLGIFNQVNATLGNNFNSIRGDLAGAAQTASGNIAQVQANWTTTISAAAQGKQQPPTPAVNNIERSIDVGAAFGTGTIAALDAANSKASGGASIVGYKWALCDSTYKPAQFGVPIAANTTGCNPVSGYASSSSDFGFPTCDLNPADYIARVTVTDSNSQSAALDVKVHVLPPSYADPATRLLNLAQAYSALSVTQFLSFFDETAFAGYTALQENIRNTFPLLGSMNINPQISQSSTSCNDATVRANWVQNYTYKPVCTANPLNPNEIKCVGGADLVFTQNEQLSVRMLRTPGKGWFITDFQGDNGKVQGQLPGPVFTDSPQPDLVAAGVYPTYAGQPNTAAIPVPPGSQYFSAIIANVGGADLTAATNVRFTLQDATGAAINGSMDVPLSLPLKAGSSQTVSATLTVPPNVGQAFTVVANANPGCTVAEAHCDTGNIATDSLFVGTPVKLGLLSSSPMAFVTNGPAQIVEVSVSDPADSVTLALPTGFTFSTTAALPSACTNTSMAAKLVFSAAGTACWVVAATYDAPPGPGSMTVTAVASGVSVPLSVPYSVTGPALTSATKPSMIAGSGTAAQLVVTMSLPGTYYLALPTGISAAKCAASPCPATIGAAGGQLVWDLTASFAATPDSLNPNPVLMLSPTTGSSAYSWALPYSVTGPTMTPSSLTLVAGDLSTVRFTVDVSQPGSYLLTLPAGISASPCDATTVTTCVRNVTSPGTIIWNMSAGLTAATGNFTLANSTLTISPDGVPYAQPIPYIVNPPGAPQISPSPFALTPGATTWQTLTATFTSSGPFTLQGAGGAGTLPAGISLDTANTPATQSLGANNTISWNLKVNYSVAPNTYTDLYISDGIHAPWPVAYTVAGMPNYVISNVVVKDSAGVLHNSPFTGADGFQMGENFTETITVKNVGNGTATGTITVAAGCVGTGCGAPSTLSIPADNITPPPPVGAGTTQDAVVNVTMGPNMVAGSSYTATFSLSTAIAQDTTDDSYVLPNNPTNSFQVVDFTVASGQPFTGTQDLIVGTTGQISAMLTELGTSTPFAIPVTITPVTGVLYTPTSASVTPASPTSPAAVTFSLDTTGATASGVHTVTLTATNHGVSKTVSQDVNLMSASFSTDTAGTPLTRSIFLNDPSNPLVVQVGQSVGVMLPAVNMKMTATPSVAGDMLLAPATNNDTHFTSTFTVESGFGGATGPTVTGSNASFMWQITANGATTSVVGLQVEGRLLNSSPQIIPSPIVYTLYVKAVSVPDLQVVKVTPARAINSNYPWLAGEAINFDVVVKNNGGVTSNSTQLTMMLGPYEVATASVPGLAPADPPYTVTVRAVAPDFSGTPVPTLKTKIEADSRGDFNYNDNICMGLTPTLSPTDVCSNGTGTQTNVPASDWSISIPVGTGSGATDATALDITSGGVFQPIIAYTVANGGSPSTSVDLIAGLTTTGVQVSGFGSSTLSSGSTYVSVSVPSPATMASGYGYAQVLAQMKAGGTVTATRQATVHLVNYPPGPTGQPISITTDTGAPSHLNFAGTGGATLQLNGPLAQRFTLTPSCGPTCSGTVDLTINDAANTTTTPTQFNQAPLSLPPGTPQTATVSAALDPNGEITTGAAAGYGISATGMVAIAGRRGSVSPSPVGPPIPLYVNVGDIDLIADSGLSATLCANAVPGGSATTINAHWDTMGSGFNATISWQVVLLTSTSNPPILGGNYVGSANYPSYTAVSATVQAAQAVESLLQYSVEVTISNGISSATKYFPFYVDASSAQNFCGATMGARGYSSQRLKGSWSRSALSGTLATSAARISPSTSGGLPDLRISASDVSFTPSMPKLGDTVQVTFRVRNEGTGNAVGVPIALQINGSTVAIDSFDVAAGRSTLGGLQWNGALPASAPLRMVTVAARRDIRSAHDPEGATGRARIGETAPEVSRVPVVSAMVVVDPQHTIQQKSTLEKSAPLTHFSLRSPDGPAAAGVAALPGSQRILLELADGACVGLRMATGSAGPCGSADLEMNVDDKGGLTLDTLTGVADLGGSFGPATSSARLDPARLSSGRYVSQTPALAGHSYAVQLSGSTPVLTVVSIRNPGELDAKTRALFRASALRVLGKLGGNTAGPTGPGDVAPGTTSLHTVFVELVAQTQ